MSVAAQRFNIVSFNSGGTGDPRKRDAARIEEDLRDGLISESAAREVHGWKDGR